LLMEKIKYFYCLPTHIGQIVELEWGNKQYFNLGLRVRGVSD
jgi:hypothetical protein